MQEIYIGMDDSGVLSEREKYAIYGGVVFINQMEKEQFSKRYRALIHTIRCLYCDHSCNHQCPEIKSYMINFKHRLRILALLKQYRCFAAIIRNAYVYGAIYDEKGGKGRYIDYVQKMTIKHILMELIQEQQVDPYQDLKLVVQIDEQSMKSNGYYDLHDSLKKELLQGIDNLAYGILRKPIVHANLDLHVQYLDSKTNVLIQAADIIAGSTRRYVYQGMDTNEYHKHLEYLWLKECFP